MQLTGGQAVALAFRVHRVDFVLGIPGVHHRAICATLLSGIRHVVGSAEFEQLCNAGRARDALGLEVETDFDRFR